jgi:parallel beta-helix repeat protein
MKNYTNTGFSVFIAMVMIASMFASMIVSPGAIGAVQANELLVTHDPISVNDDAELAALGLPGDGSADNPYIIENLKIDAAGIYENAIHIGNTTKHLEIRNCQLTGAAYADSQLSGQGLLLRNVRNVTVEDNDCHGNDVMGIALFSSSGIVIRNNTANENNDCGIYLYDSSDNVVENNTANENDYYGISLVSSDDNAVRDNTANENYGYSINLIRSNENIIEGNIANGNTVGIYLESSNENIIEGNIANGNTVGIYLESSSSSIESTEDNLIVNNRLSANTLYGVCILNLPRGGTVTGTFVYGNIFTDNNGATSVYSLDHRQAEDITGSCWYSPSSPHYGNYWSDWTSPDDNKDGFVDSPYLFSGGQDDYPLAILSREIEITSPADSATVYAPTVLVTGTMAPGYKVDVNGILVSADNDGTFSVVIALLEGDNTIEARTTTLLPVASSSITVIYVNQLQQDVDDLSARLEDVQSRLSDAEALLESTRAWVQSISSQLATAWNEQNATAGDVDSLLAEVQAMKASLTSLRDSLNATDGNVSALLGDLDDAIGSLTSMESNLTEMQSELASVQEKDNNGRDDPLPLVLGAVGLVTGLVAIAFSVVYARRPKAP